MPGYELVLFLETNGGRVRMDGSHPPRLRLPCYTTLRDVTRPVLAQPQPRSKNTGAPAAHDRAGAAIAAPALDQPLVVAEDRRGGIALRSAVAGGGSTADRG